MIEVTGLDRPGLLYELTTELGKQNLNINSARIVTYGEKAVDVFYVTDLTGGKVMQGTRQQKLRKALAGGAGRAAGWGGQESEPGSHRRRLDFAAASLDIPEMDCSGFGLNLRIEPDRRRNSDECRSRQASRSRKGCRPDRGCRRRPACARAGAERMQTLERENADLKDRLLRALAEMENLRRRTEREIAGQRAYSITKFATDMSALPITCAARSKCRSEAGGRRGGEASRRGQGAGRWRGTHRARLAQGT